MSIDGLGKSFLIIFPSAMLDEQYHEELRTLRNLEKAIRTCTKVMLTLAPRDISALTSALKEVTEARKIAVTKSRFIPFK